MRNLLYPSYPHAPHMTYLRIGYFDTTYAANIRLTSTYYLLCGYTGIFAT
jgi:hypothetical protein